MFHARTIACSARPGRWLGALYLSLAPACGWLAREPARAPGTGAPAQPFAGACPDWSTLGFGDVLHGTSADAGLVLVPTCVPRAAHGCAYSFELTSAHRVRLALMTDDFDGALALFGEEEDHSGELACVEDTPEGDSHHARLDRVLSAGRYVAFVTAPMGDAGRFELFAEREAIPSEAAVCAAAPKLTPGDTRRGSTEGRASRFTSACAGGDGPDAAFAFSLAEPARVRLRQQTAHDGILSLRTSTESACAELACSDDFVDGEHAQLTRTLPAGDYVAVTDGYGTITGGGSFALSYAAFPVPPASSRAEQCARAPMLPLDGSPVQVDTLTRPGLFRATCLEGDAPETLLRVHLEERSLVSFALESAELHAALYVLAGCGDDARELGCALGPRTDRAFAAEAGPAGSHDLLVEDLAAGDYTLVVDGANAHAMGSATVRARAISGALPAL